MSNKYQVVVVGAGPSGSSAAYFLGKAGVSVILLDKSEFPRPKLCGGAISPRALSVLDEMDFTPKIEYYQKITGVKFISPRGEVVTGNVPKIPNFRDFGYVVPRTYLDSLLKNRAINAGNVEFAQEEVVDLISKNGCITGIKTKRGQKINSDVVVLASGAMSRLAQRYNLIRHQKERTMLALEGRFDGIKTDDKLLIYFQKDILPAYFWIFPEGNGRANVGLGISDLTKKVNPFEIYRDIISSNKTVKQILNGSNLVDTPRTWLIRSKNPRETALASGVLAVGDSGGFANQFTGEGIYYALQSGKFAAKAISEAVRTGDFSSEGLSTFRTLSEEFNEDIDASDKLIQAFKDPERINEIIEQSGKSPELNSLLQGVVTNVIPKSEVIRFLQ